MKVHKSLQNLPHFTRSVITVGSFDGVHHGHRKILSRLTSRAKEINGKSVVITFDPHPREVISHQDSSFILLNDTQEKLQLLDSLGIDHVVLVPFTLDFSQQSPEEYIKGFLFKNFNPQVIIIGYDHRFGLNRQGDYNLLKKYTETEGIQLEQIVRQDLEQITVSSTKIRNCLLSGEVEKANRLLKSNYLLSGKVVHGDKNGHKFGFPTANIKLRNNKKLVPKNGVYSVLVNLDESQFQGMAYIGKRPTLNDGLESRIEVNIFDFNYNIYNQEIQLELIDYIRDDKKFNNTDQLINQLKVDKHNVIANLSQEKNDSVDHALAIAILNFNNLEYLEAFLPSVIEHSIDQSKIYIIDNNSQDDSMSMVEEWFPEIDLIYLGENYGFAEGYNKGIAQIKEPYILLLNSDVKVTAHWLEPLLSSIQVNNIAGVMPKIKSIDNNDDFEYAGASGGFIDSLGYPFCRGRIFDHVEKDQGQYDEPISVAWTTGAAMLLKKNVFENLGGFDKDYFAHQEEIDFCIRARRAGYMLKSIPSSEVYHLGGGTLDYESSNKVYLNFRNNLTTLLKNEEVLKLAWLFPTRLILDGIAGLKFLLGGRFDCFLAIIKSHLSVYSKFLSILNKRSQINAIIEKYSIGPANTDGIIKGSIVIKYFIFGKKTFSQL